MYSWADFPLFKTTRNRFKTVAVVFGEFSERGKVKAVAGGGIYDIAGLDGMFEDLKVKGVNCWLLGLKVEAIAVVPVDCA